MEHNQYLNEILYLIENRFLKGNINFDDLDKIKFFISDLRLREKFLDLRDNATYNDINYLNKSVLKMFLGTDFFIKINNLHDCITKYGNRNIPVDYLSNEFNIDKWSIKSLLEKYFYIDDPNLKDSLEFVKIYFLKHDSQINKITLGFTLSSKEIDSETSVDDTFGAKDFYWVLEGEKLYEINDEDKFKNYFRFYNESDISRTIDTKIISYKIKDFAVFNAVILDDVKNTHLHCKMIELNNKITTGFQSKKSDGSLSEAYDFGTVYP